jgi:hypothetical protein
MALNKTSLKALLNSTIYNPINYENQHDGLSDMINSFSAQLLTDINNYLLLGTVPPFTIGPTVYTFTNFTPSPILQLIILSMCQLLKSEPTDIISFTNEFSGIILNLIKTTIFVGTKVTGNSSEPWTGVINTTLAEEILRVEMITAHIPNKYSRNSLISDFVDKMVDALDDGVKLCYLEFPQALIQ